MFLEEFYSYDASGDKLIAENMYMHTLACWLFNNDFQVYENLLEYYEEKEEYAVCEGIHRALAKIDDIMHNRFNSANKVSETEESVTYTHEEHLRVSTLIFEDILKEIYEKQINKFKEDR